MGNPNVEIFLSKVDEDLFKTIETPTRCSNLSSDDWKAIRSLADDRSIVIKKADNGCTSSLGQGRLYQRRTKATQG